MDKAINQITCNGVDVLWVEVSEDATDFVMGVMIKHLLKFRQFKNVYRDNEFWNNIELPKGNKYEIIGCITKGECDFQCEELAESMGSGDSIWYKDYTSDMAFNNPQDSFLSKLKSESIDLSKRWVVLKINSQSK